jgi:superfamily I DNA/RNA helicase/Zn-dependent peptidase ImmA (M78 family)
VKQLADDLGILLNGVAAGSPALQGSLANFRPYQDNIEEDPYAGVLTYNCTLTLPEIVFLVGHEIAHCILHKEHTFCHGNDLDELASGTPPVVGQVEVYNPRNMRERDANIFALELLMPHGELRYEYLRRVEAKVLEGLEYNTVVEDLAAFFGVEPRQVLAQLINSFLTPVPPVPDASFLTAQDTTKADKLPAQGDFQIEVAASAPSVHISEISAPQGLEASDSRNATGPTEAYDIDSEQVTAAHSSTPRLVIAGPGSGKTSALVERVRYLIQDEHIPPGRILVLTFSNKAANQLRSRLDLKGLAVEEMKIATFHAYGLDFLRMYWTACDLPKDFRLLDPARAGLFLEDIHDYLPGGFYVPDEGSTHYFDKLLEDISRAKDDLRTPEDYALAVSEMQQLEGDDEPKYSDEDIARSVERAGIYRVYEEHKRQRGRVDYGDLVMLPVWSLRNRTDLRREVQGLYDHVLVDEYQDINFASGELLRLLTSPQYGGRGNLWAVGDIHQSIYRFRGAFPDRAGPQAFTEDYRHTSTIGGTGAEFVHELENNYRSVEPIVELANHLRDSMQQGATRRLKAMRKMPQDNSIEASMPAPTEPVLYLTEFESTEEELAAVISSIRDRYESGLPYSAHAILCRVNDQADAAARALTEAGIPVTRVGDFYNRPEVQEVVSVVSALARGARLPLFTLARKQPGLNRVLEIGDELNLAPLQAIRDPRVLNLLGADERGAMDRLSVMLYSLASARSVWGLMVSYIFGWSALISELFQTGVSGAQRQEARQALYALGQLLLIAYAFDIEEEEAAALAATVDRNGGANPKSPEAISASRNRMRNRLKRFMRYYNALIVSRTRVDVDAEPEPDELFHSPLGGSGEVSQTQDSERSHSNRHIHAGSASSTPLTNSREAPAVIEAGGHAPGAVSVMTMHAAKGLEFRSVYLVGLHHNTPRKDVLSPAPPGFRRAYQEGGEQDDKALLYVAVTRAMERLSISWARYETSVAQTREPDSDSTALPEEGVLPNAAPPATPGAAHRVASPSWTPRTTRSGNSNNSREMSGRSAGRAHARVLDPVYEFKERKPEYWGSLLDKSAPSRAAAPIAIFSSVSRARLEGSSIHADLSKRDEFDYWELREYDKCPRKRYYKYDHRCLGRQDSSKSNYYRGIKSAHRELVLGLVETGLLPEQARLLHAYAEAWPTYYSARMPVPGETEGSEVVDSRELGGAVQEHPTSSYISPETSDDEASATIDEDEDEPDHWWRRGIRVLDKIYEHYSQQAETHQYTPVSIEHRVSVALQSCRVGFTIDRAEVDRTGNKRLVLTYVGNLQQDELDRDTDLYRLLSLYALSEENERDSAEIVVEVIGLHGVRHFVADKAYKKAAAYRKRERGESKAVNLLCKLEESAHGIRSGMTDPKRDYHCFTCAFYPLICPMPLAVLDES